MPRFYVKNVYGYWNVFSTIIDDYIYDDFIPFCEMKSRILMETFREKNAELNTLRTDNPQLNIMPLEEAEESIRQRMEYEREGDEMQNEILQEEEPYLY